MNYKNTNFAANQKYFRNPDDNRKAYAVTYSHIDSKNIQIVFKELNGKDFESIKKNDYELVSQCFLKIDSESGYAAKDSFYNTWFVNRGNKIVRPYTKNKECAEYLASLVKRLVLDKNNALCKAEYYLKGYEYADTTSYFTDGTNARLMEVARKKGIATLNSEQDKEMKKLENLWKERYLPVIRKYNPGVTNSQISSFAYLVQLCKKEGYYDGVKKFNAYFDDAVKNGRYEELVHSMNRMDRK